MDRFKKANQNKKYVDDSRIDVTFTREYLDKTSDSGCYAETNLGSPEQLASAKRKLRPVLNFHKNPKIVLSVGVGSGAELLALHELFESRGVTIKGLDLSSIVIEKAKVMLKKYDISPEFVVGSAIALPFDSCSIDILIESAILHEIYSYVPDGKWAWKKAIVDVANCLSENGIFLLRDFSSPTEKEIELEFKSDFSRKFYEYFVRYYRVFDKWGGGSSKILDKRTEFSNDYPKMNEDKSIRLNLTKTAELMLHFRNFLDDYSHNIAEFMDSSWKEINETYLVPNPNRPDVTPMVKEEYVNEVIATANEALKGSNYELICLQDVLSKRLSTAKLLKEHFNIRDIEAGNETDNAFVQITEKMELIFKKIRRQDPHSLIRSKE
ncbi:class I SAM-dependent methyltransferase [Candidatus Marsarchaeota archaeon]|nr:class I SAM-dependent methyltransferase [Candidatus Marsarchaeota archaeon]MCL5092583.1 class I SAM-dependent methyltransferase [Candidatus Marsarchaeota archaeon]